jgi:hypothetical protein
MKRAISVGKNLAAGVETVVYTVPEGYTAEWELLYLHNASGNTKTVTVDWYDLSTTTHVTILTAYSMASKEYFKFDGSRIVMDEGDEVHISTEASSAFGVVCTFNLERKA